MSGQRARGGDFSSAQPIAEVDRVARAGRGLQFGFVKASQGVDYLNPLLDDQVRILARATGKVGYYHYLEAGVPGSAQWDHFESAIAGLPAGPVALDYEQQGTSDVQARAFIRRGRQRGYRVGLYGSVHVTGRRLRQAWRWVAYWSRQPPPGRWDVWQWTDGGGDQDYDLFSGHTAELDAWWRRQSRHKPKRKVRWWLHDETTQTELGPLHLATVGPVFLAYALRHPKSHAYTLERK